MYYSLHTWTFCESHKGSSDRSEKPHAFILVESDQSSKSDLHVLTIHQLLLLERRRGANKVNWKQKTSKIHVVFIYDIKIHRLRPGVMACTKNNNAVYTTKKKMASNSIWWQAHAVILLQIFSITVSRHAFKTREYRKRRTLSTRT